MYKQACLACTEILGPARPGRMYGLTYVGPGTEPQNLLVMLCGDCGLEVQDPVRLPVVEAIVSSRIIRLEYPNKQWTPQE